MRNITSVLCALWLGAGVVSTPVSAAVYTLDLYNVDDVMTAYITNSTYTSQEILQATFLQNTGSVNISGFVKPGMNDITIQDYNYYQGWTYGYNFSIDSVPFAVGSCGTANSYGCDNNAQSPINSIVFSTDVKFNVGGVPEASTWTMMLLGFAGLGFAVYHQRGRKGTKVNAAA
jgi:hypothetical protein